MTKRLNIALAGGSPGLQVLRALRKTPHRVSVVLAAKTPKKGESGISLRDSASAAGIPVMREAQVKAPEFARTMRELEVDLFLCVRSLFIVDEAVLRAPSIGSFNMHPGPLPEYGGRNVISWALFNGEETHGSTVHWMESEVDAGPIAFEARFPVSEADTAISVTRRAVREGVAILLKVVELAAVDPGQIPRIAQDVANRRYFGPEVPWDGVVDWNRPAKRIHDFVRACDFYPYSSPWGVPVAALEGRRVGIGATERTGRRTSEAPGTVQWVAGGAVDVACADEWLRVTQLVVEGDRHDAHGILVGDA
jgi:UDP-4-amino-4-deoxy-L-arabinose formyltransferase/UDP-glucuronic acid dehydrogenase (UDP-4-keto-hexauronic acid decarboxylating)